MLTTMVVMMLTLFALMIMESMLAMSMTMDMMLLTWMTFSTMILRIMAIATLMQAFDRRERERVEKKEKRLRDHGLISSLIVGYQPTSQTNQFL